MARQRKPELDRPINIRFPTWELFGDRKLKAPHFIMLPMHFRNELRWDMPGDLFKFFCYLIGHAALQSTPGEIRGDAYSLSRACRCKPESVLSYVSRLIERELIQELSEIKPARVEERKLENNIINGAPGAAPLPVLKLKGALNTEWMALWASIPDEIRTRHLGIGHLDFEAAHFRAAMDKGNPFRGVNFTGGGISRADGSHMIGPDFIETEVQGVFPGETRGHEAFGLSYCRLFLHEPRGVLFFLMCVRHYAAAAGAGLPGFASSDLKTWLSSEWWMWFIDPITGEHPEKLSYSGNNPHIAELLHNTSTPA